jgi:hypothetical protein
VNLTNYPDRNVDIDPLAQLMTVKAFAERYPDLMTEAALRWHIYCRAHNGMNQFGVVIQLGRSVYLDVARFCEWLDSHRVNGCGN